jgi:hypothetical protein
MIVRSPHPQATEKLIAALEAYPLLLLLLAHDHPTRIWILDRGEKASSAQILTPQMRVRRWHSAGLGIDDCEGLVDVAPGYLALVTGWRTLQVMRHEFAHVATTFFSPATRHHFQRLYEEALRQDAFAEPLARESVGEYVACGLSGYLSDELRPGLQGTDPGLYRAVERFLREAEELSAKMATVAGAGVVNGSGRE